MNPQLCARIALTFLCLLQGAATIAIDINRTHAGNTTWPGHARFHVVWQSLTMMLLSITEFALIWQKKRLGFDGFYLVMLLAALSPIAFLIATLSRKTFEGTLSDPNGIPPLKLKLFGRLRSCDMNLLAVVAALIALIAICEMYRS